MEVEKIIKLINNPQDILSEDVTDLDNLLSKHPYFQSGQLLLTRGLLNTDSIRYNQQLKKAAAYTLNREKLFSLVTKMMGRKDAEISEEIKPKAIEERLELGKPFTFK